MLVPYLDVKFLGTELWDSSASSSPSYFESSNNCMYRIFQFVPLLGLCHAVETLSVVVFFRNSDHLIPC